MGYLKTFFIVFILYFQFPAQARYIKHPQWHCGTDCLMNGSTEKAYDSLFAKDTFIGRQKFSCINYSDNIIESTEDDYVIRLEGDMTTGFSPADEIEVNMARFTDKIPNDFRQKFNKLHIYSDYPIGNIVVIHLLGISEDPEGKKVLLTIKSPTYIANAVKAFVESAVLSIEKKQFDNQIASQ